MNLSKRVVLAVLCFVVLAVPIGALAANLLLHGSATLAPVGDEPNASGSASLHQTGWVPSPFGGELPSGTCSVRCTGLTTGATYSVELRWPDNFAEQLGAGAARKGGSLAVTGDWYGIVRGAEMVRILRVGPTLNAPVLSGDVVWNWK